MAVLLDTNVLCRLAEQGHPFHHAAARALSAVRQTDEAICLVPQVIYEYYVVSTRPVAQNGLGMTAAAARKAIGGWVDLFRLLRDERGILQIWQDLVQKYEVIGKPAHDARLVAAMIRHQIPRLMTFDANIFRRFTEISVICPNDE